MDTDTKRLYDEISKLNRQVGWLTSTLESIANGDTLGQEPADHARVSLELFKKRFSV